MKSQPNRTVEHQREAGSSASLPIRYGLLAERIFLLSGVLMLVNLGRIVYPATAAGGRSIVFELVAWFVYAFVYCVPLYLLLLFAGGLLGMRASRGADPSAYLIRTTLFCLAALAGMFVTQALIYADSWVYAIFQFHMNGFVLNLLMTPGGLGSMDMSTESAWGFAGRLLVILAAQGVILVAVFRWRWLQRNQRRFLGGYKARLALLAVMVVLALGQAVGYGFARAAWYRPVLQVSDRIPFYVPITFNHMARACGWSTSETGLSLPDSAASSLRYPKHPLRFRSGSRRSNIMILMCETLRSDMVTPEIMPHTSGLAARSLQFTQHYSSGNSTREGVFGAMASLHGTYWRGMLRDGGGSAVVRLLQDSGYELELYTSQSFTYPEFDRTVFAAVPPARMHVRSAGSPPWQRDRDNVADIIRWLSARDKGVPFMTFMFFESSHARYAFPPSSVIRPDYCESLDYATDLINPSPTRVRQVFNRYINAVHHLDSQLGRLIEYLENSGQLADTIVVITGDHGDAFHEKGRWGHGGHSFLEEQVHVPLILHLPGAAPQVSNDLSSHVDILPTVLTRLGIANPPEDYSVGRDLLQSPSGPSYVVNCGWDAVALIADREKYVFPSSGFRLPVAFSRKDQPLNEKDVRERLRPQLLDLMNKMRQFLKR